MSKTSLFQQSLDIADAEHREESFDDFAIQPLLPNRQSQMGPALAAADVDADGDVDVFLGGSRGYPGQLLINDGGALVASRVPALVDDAQSEDIDAVFFDESRKYVPATGPKQRMGNIFNFAEDRNASLASNSPARAAALDSCFDQSRAFLTVLLRLLSGLLFIRSSSHQLATTITVS